MKLLNAPPDALRISMGVHIVKIMMIASPAKMSNADSITLVGMMLKVVPNALDVSHATIILKKKNGL